MPTSQTPWVDGLTFAQTFRKTVERAGQREALIFPQLKDRRTYSQFHQDVETAARGLLALGVKQGEHVGIWATNWPEWVIVQLATAQIGAVLVNINPAYRANELKYVLNQADITTIFLTDQVKTTDYFAILEELCPDRPTSSEEWHVSACPKLRRVISIKNDPRPGYLTWTDFVQQASCIREEQLSEREAQVRPDDVVNIQYTSGTTGFPKGAMLTHRNLLLNAYYVGDRQDMSEEDRVCIAVPYYHCFGCVMGNLMSIIYGACMVIPAELFDPLAVLQAVHAERCTAVYGVPTMFIAELNHPQFAEFDLSSLRTGIMAGSPCPMEVMRAVADKMGADQLTIAYGLTEASPVITQTRTTDSLEHRVGTVGTVIAGLDVRLVEPGTMNDVPQGQQGELIVRGHCVMKGYYNKPEETAKAITEDGWLRSGDLAQLTEDGYYRITGRLKDMIIRGGENIYPREIEEFLYTHPDIEDVQVVGLPDEKFGEELSAWIRLKPGATVSDEDIREFCRGQIAHFKIPRHVIFVDTYPTTVTGKIQKFKLRELGIERFGLHKAAGIETA